MNLRYANHGAMAIVGVVMILVVIMSVILVVIMNVILVVIMNKHCAIHLQKGYVKLLIHNGYID